jgi:hypothetical protein
VNISVIIPTREGDQLLNSSLIQGLTLLALQEAKLRSWKCNTQCSVGPQELASWVGWLMGCLMTARVPDELLLRELRLCQGFRNLREFLFRVMGRTVG